MNEIITRLDKIIEHLDRQAVDRPEATEGLLTVKEAARRLGVSPRTVRDLIHCGKLHATRIGKGRGTHRISLRDFESYKRDAAGHAALMPYDSKRRLLKL